MGLRTAGLISGFGNGLGQGLSQMQSGIIQQGLMNQRFEHDDAALAGERSWQTKKLEEQRKYDTLVREGGYAHDATVRAGEQAFTAGQNDKTRQNSMDIHNLSESGANARASATEAGATARNNADNAASLANTRLGHTLTNEGNREKENAADARQKLEIAKDIQVAKIQASKGIEKVTDPATKARIDAQMKKLDIHGDQLKNALDPAEMDTIKADITETIQNIDQLVGVQPTEKPRDIVKDRFGSSPITKGR